MMMVFILAQLLLSIFKYFSIYISYLNVEAAREPITETTISPGIF